MPAVSFLTSSAGSGIVGFLTKGIGSKLIVYVVVLWAWTSLISWALSKVPALNFSGAFAGMPDAFLWGLYYVDFPFILSAWISAESTALLVRLRKG